MRNVAKTAVMILAVAGLTAAAAQAAPLQGSYSINGAFVPVNLGGAATTLGAAEALDFVPTVLPGDVVVPTPGVAGEFLVAQATDDFAHLAGMTGNIKDVSVVPMGNMWYPVAPIMAFQQVGDVTFDLDTLMVNSQDDEFMFVHGTGMFKRAGFDDTRGIMNFTAQTAGDNGFATFTWSSSQVAQSVPEPTSMALMGAGLLGFAAFVRRRRA